MDKPKPGPHGHKSSDVHGLEVREGLVLVFHRPGVPAAGAIASVRATLGFEYEMVAIEVPSEKIMEIEEAVDRTGAETDTATVPIKWVDGAGAN